MTNIGLLHPGMMGVSIGVSAKDSGNTVYWVSEKRSPESTERANDAGLEDAGTLAKLCEICEVIVSVCPPAAAENVADKVITQGFSGLYIDANAISPTRAKRINDKLSAVGITFVDGGIIGGPAWKANSTWLHLSGAEAQQAADCFAGGVLETSIVSDKIGDASALKMCFAAYTKGSTALLTAVIGAAEKWGVRDALEAQWASRDETQPDANLNRARKVTAKAWRFEGEMYEIAETFRGAGLPDGFHQAAAQIYYRIAEFKGAPEVPTIEAVLKALLDKNNND